MAQKTSNRAGDVMDGPEQIRADMAKTRATLGRELGALKSRVFGTPADKGEKTMSQTKAKPARSDKKMSKAKKPGRRRSSTKGKTQEILEHALMGAALGAVKGAAEIITPEKNGTQRETKPKQ